MRTKISLLVLLGLCFGSSGQLHAAAFPLPYQQIFTNVEGITWLHLNGNPRSRRYVIKSGPRKHCTFDVYKYLCQGRPCAGEEIVSLRLSYYDPSMNEDEGVIKQYVSLNAKTIQGNIFEPKTPWTSVYAGGKVKTMVSYKKSENSTSFYLKNTFMISNYTWAKVITNETHDEILSVSMSTDHDKNSTPENRQTSIECKALN